ncbi:RDD family protein [Kitasatospora mediocidica]|uniref:RDD family protein n=1 Tax=Kitasatospora mediocidica TaxID=58352 RepID=UPI000691A638|nr:RDD family protein [Kitasatospora mediocidica]
MSNPYDTAQPDFQPYRDPVAPPVLAGWWLRFQSGLIDALIAGVPGLLLRFTTGSALLGDLLQLCIMAAIAYQEGTTGQSPGKKTVGTMVLREEDGQLLGAGRAIARRFLHALDALCCLLGYLWPLWDAKRQTFADKLVSSVVIITK